MILGKCLFLSSMLNTQGRRRPLIFTDQFIKHKQNYNYYEFRNDANRSLYTNKMFNITREISTRIK